jgi:hypothetical protein
MQMTEGDPLSDPNHAGVKENMYACGDNNQSPLDEEKSLVHLKYTS